MKKIAFFALMLLLCRNLGCTEYVELLSLLKETRSHLEWEPLGSLGRIVKGQETVVFKVGVPFLLLDYSRKVETENIVRKNGSIFIPKNTAETITEFLAMSSEVVVAPRVAVILIDPGHGGRDPGAIGRHRVNGETLDIREKDVVLEVSKRLFKLLTNRFPSKDIMLTREKDVFLELEERTELANSVTLEDNEAIIFISMHANAAFTGGPKGFEVWYLPPEYERKLIDESEVDEENREILPVLNTMPEVEYATESIMLAKEILTGLEQKVGEQSLNRGLKAETWFVVRKSKMPSVLIEIGFVTNPVEARLLSSEHYLQKVSEGIYNGILRFVNSFEDSKGFTE